MKNTVRELNLQEIKSVAGGPTPPHPPVIETIPPPPGHTTPPPLPTPLPPSGQQN